jgi:plastocyanin
MKRAALSGLVTAALLAAPGAAHADALTITMPGKFFDPARTVAVAGDTVTWHNVDLVTHNVRVAGGLFDSGPISRSFSWAQEFDQPGPYPFICTLHPFMSGNLDVVAATVAAAPDGVLAGEPLTLSGRARAGSPALGVVRTLADGSSATVTTVTPAADGMYSVETPAVEGASYRISTPAGDSPTVTPNVTARLDAHLMVEHRKRHTLVMLHTMPAAGGWRATLELYARWHYRWRPFKAVALGNDGMATFRVPAGRRTFARVALRREKGGPALVHSGVIRLSNGHAAPDPDTLGGAQHPGGGHGGH